MANDTNGVLTGLRTLFDGNSTFMSGHQIVRVRTESDKREAPDWTKDDSRVRALLLASFPKLATSPFQRRRAGRWMLVIQMYFRSKQSHREIAEELGVSINVVKMIVRGIKWAAQGMRADGSGVRATANDTNRTSYGGADKDLKQGTTKPDESLYGDRAAPINPKVPRDENSDEECEGTYLLLD